MRAVLTDIEGTTSSLAFVQDVLFPYAREKLPAYVREHRADPRIAWLLDEARRHDGRPSLDEEATVALLLRWIDEDQKVTPLKTLQGHIWEQGYGEGTLRGHVYADAARQMRAWRDKGLRLYVFSSGSIAAQKLIFGHSVHGNLAPLFAGFFDTTTGPKREPSSYLAIAAAVELPPPEILFLSDTIQELDAAHTAGMATTWLNREGQSSASVSHRQARSFDAIDL
jgi:enolase-phosphatase E1